MSEEENNLNLLSGIQETAKQRTKEESAAQNTVLVEAERMKKLLSEPVHGDLVDRFVAGVGVKEAKVRYAGHADTLEEAESMGNALGSWDVTTRGGKFLVWQVLKLLEKRGDRYTAFDPRAPDVTTVFLYETGGWGSGGDQEADPEWKAEFGGTFSNRRQLDSYPDDRSREAVFKKGLFHIWKQLVPSTVTCTCHKGSAHDDPDSMGCDYKPHGKYPLPPRDQFGEEIRPEDLPDEVGLDHIEFDVPSVTDQEKDHAFDDLPPEVKLRWDEHDRYPYRMGRAVVRLRKLGKAKEVSDVFANAKVPANYYKLVEEAVEAVRTIPAKFRDVPNFSITKDFHLERTKGFTYVKEAIAWCEARPEKRWYVRYAGDGQETWAAWEVGPPTKEELKEKAVVDSLAGLAPATSPAVFKDRCPVCAGLLVDGKCQRCLKSAEETTQESIEAHKSDPIDEEQEEQFEDDDANLQEQQEQDMD